MKSRFISLLGIFLFIASTQSQNLELFALANSEHDEFAPMWSSDGQMVYWQRFVSDAGTGSQTEFYVTDIANPSSPELILSLNGSLDNATWSPNGQYLAYAESTGIIHIINQYGAEITRFSGARDDYPLVWSPDSQKLLAFVGAGISLLQLDGKSRVLLETYAFRYADYEDSYAWSQDGESVVIASEGDIHLVRFDGTAAINLTSTLDIVEFAPSLSPDGLKIVFVSLSSSYQYTLTLINSDGTEHRQLAESRFSDFCPQWSPDGINIVFTRKHSIQFNESVLMLYNHETGQISWLDHPNGETLGCGQWSPDSEWIAFQGNHPDWYIRNIYVASRNAFKTEITEEAIYYEVSFVPPYLSASVYSDSGGRNIIGILGNRTVLSLRGEIEEVWLGIEFEGQAAWIYQNYVMGRIDPILFCNDTRVIALIDRLKEAVRNRDGETFANLVAPVGLYLGLQGHTIHLSHSQVRNIFNDREQRYFGNNANTGDAIVRTLADDIVLLLEEDLLAANVSIACQDNQDSLSNTSVLYAVHLPNYTEMPNFYSLMRPGEPGFELDWGAWGIGISYWQGEPKILALGHYVWTP